MKMCWSSPNLKGSEGGLIQLLTARDGDWWSSIIFGPMTFLQLRRVVQVVSVPLYQYQCKL